MLPTPLKLFLIMHLSNYERMIQLAEEIFDVKSDPGQLDVDESVIQRLLSIHPATLSEYDEGNGPVIWILLIPTTKELMHPFLENKISEKELYERTPTHGNYEAIYLCSALVLEEYRGKGLAKNMTIKAIQEIQKDHNIQALFVWPFSDAGLALAKHVASVSGLPLNIK